MFTYTIYNYPAALETLKTHGGVILAMSFPDNKIFVEAVFLIIFHFSAYYQGKGSL